MRHFNLLLMVVFWFTCFFPYLQYAPISGYTQPIFFVLALVLLFSATRFPISRNVFLLLGAWCILGLSMLFYDVVLGFGVSLRSLQNLFPFVSIPVVGLTALVLYHKNKKLLLRMLKVSLFLWFVVGLVQFIWNPSFLSFLLGVHSQNSLNSFNSGRGVAALAPEPSYYGFHLVLLVSLAVILKLPKKYVLLGLVQVIFFAQSMSVILALVLGAFIYLLFLRPIIFFGVLLTAALSSVFFSLYGPSIEFMPEGSRAGYLLHTAIQTPVLLLEDYSVNSRVGGLYTSLLSDGLPHGFSTQEWRVHAESILSETHWLNEIRMTSPASGLGAIYFQTGLIGTFLLFMFFGEILRASFSRKKEVGQLVVFSIPFVFLSQFSLATPLFAILLGISLSIPYQKSISRRSGKSIG